MKNSEQFNSLVEQLRKLPGVGRRSAERIARALIIKKNTLLRDLVASLTAADKELCCCNICGALTLVKQNPCRICNDTERDNSLLCVVEDPGDVDLLEDAGGYKGKYHVLMGRISPVRGQGIAGLRLKSLIQRINEGNVKEVVLALGSDVEGDATAQLLREALSDQLIKITRPAMGLPAGSGITYCDAWTLAKAINARQEL
ncbi:MAG: recombination protein RecR [Lentisphaerae bacterium]|nr:recombination protein RecR [Lentisphaerota bacterium]